MKLYTINEVAEILSVTPRTVQNYIRDKKLESTKINDYLVRITEEQLDSFIFNGKARDKNAK